MSSVRRNKYRVRTDAIRKLERLIDGHQFDSKAEAKRYCELRLLERAGEIHRLKVHPVFKLTLNGLDLGEYRADFEYRERKLESKRADGVELWSVGPLIVEDVKGKPTKLPLYRLKRKLVWAIHQIEIREVG